MKNRLAPQESYVRCSKCGKRMQYTGEITDKHGRRYEKYRCMYCYHPQVYAVA